MKRTKVQMTTAALAVLMLLGGCGEAPYDITEKEQDIIVNYAAHVVTKYNAYQKEGLTYVNLEEAEEEETEVKEAVSEESQEESLTENAVSSVLPENVQENTDTVYTPVSLTEVFGTSALTVDYVGARLEDSYVEKNYYALYPDAGKMYLVLGIDITNESEEPVDVDYLTRGAKFQVTVNDETTSSAETTILMEDFSTYQGRIEAGETKETVLLFQIPATVTSVENVKLIVSDGDNYQIILENE